MIPSVCEGFWERGGVADGWLQACCDGAACLRQGRDANRRLQRAIKAGKAREGMPLLVQGLRKQLEGWAEDRGCPFLLDGCDYRVRASLWRPALGSASTRHTACACLPDSSRAHRKS